MKKIFILGALLISGLTFAQTAKPFLQQEGDLVKATYYYENGKVQQEGFFKEGKLDGVWVSYDENGNKKAIAEYSEGLKTGKWIFFNEKNICQVDYSNSKINSVKNLEEKVIAHTN